MSNQQNVSDAKALFRRLSVKYPRTPEGLRALVEDPEWRGEFPLSQCARGPTRCRRFGLFGFCGFGACGTGLAFFLR
jgi:3-deoxy-D-arabino-heptulosonate 7-phosphate (DAHP) synthase